MRILLIGSGDFYHIGAFFRDALTDLGHYFSFLDENSFLRPLRSSKMHKIAYRLLGRRPLTYWALNRQIIRLARMFRPEVILVTKGAYISPNTLATVRQETNAFLVNYATDDPFNPANQTADLVAGIPLYDLYACTKRAMMEDIRRAGCREVAYVR
ncbi:MAG TPA: hypothetical protein VFU22_28720, partial [Roseiflexaceae bacterium]|nr:hypothetical protein [Roseiflexaceae bacterium]